MRKEEGGRSIAPLLNRISRNSPASVSAKEGSPRET